jgi:hypothetical protein
MELLTDEFSSINSLQLAQIRKKCSISPELLRNDQDQFFSPTFYQGCLYEKKAIDPKIRKQAKFLLCKSKISNFTYRLIGCKLFRLCTDNRKDFHVFSIKQWTVTFYSLCTEFVFLTHEEQY